MQHRPHAGGAVIPNTTGLLFLSIGVSVGIVGGLLSLLLDWPGFGGTPPMIHAAAIAHVPILIFYAALPAVVGGLSAIDAPFLVGGRESALPRLERLGLGLFVASLLALVLGAVSFRISAIVLSANLLAFSMVLVGANHTATILNRRELPYRHVPFSAWSCLISGVFTVCAAPIAAASFTMQLVSGDASVSACQNLVWPSLAAILCVLLGVATDLLGSRGERWSVGLLASLLGAGMLAIFMCWSSSVLEGHGAAMSSYSVHAIFLLMVAPFVVMWRPGLGRIVGLARERRPPAVFAAGMAILLPLGLVFDMLGMARHEALSLAVVFGVFAGVYQHELRGARHQVAVMLAEAQFGLLLAASLAVLLPVSLFIKTLGAAMAALSIGVFAARLLTVSFSSVRRSLAARRLVRSVMIIGHTP